MKALALMNTNQASVYGLGGYKKIRQETIVMILFARVQNAIFFEKAPLSEAEKYPNFRVTLCSQNDTTNVDFAYVESEYTIREIFQRFMEDRTKRL